MFPKIPGVLNDDVPRWAQTEKMELERVRRLAIGGTSRGGWPLTADRSTVPRYTVDPVHSPAVFTTALKPQVRPPTLDAAYI